MGALMDAPLPMFSCLARTARPVVEDTESDSPVPDLAHAHLTANDDDPNDKAAFVDMTQQFAEHLRASQTGANSGGLLTVADVRLAGRPGCSW